MKHAVVAILAYLGLSTVVFGQTDSKQFDVEISGSVLYHYSNLTWGPYPGESFERFIRSHTVTLQPSVGYFVTPEFEMVLEPHYSYRFYQQNSGFQQGGNITEIVLDRWTHNLGVNGGPVYNHRIGDVVILFGGFHFGVSWTNFGFNPLDPRLRSPWKKAEISFPKISGGTKIFFAENWATVLLCQFSKTTNYNGYDGQTNTELAIGLGLSVFL